MVLEPRTDVEPPATCKLLSFQASPELKEGSACTPTNATKLWLLVVAHKNLAPQ